MSNYIVYIDGAAGTTGLQIYQRLANDPEIEVLTLPDAQRKSMPHRLDAVSQAHLSILCLPDDAAREIATAAPAHAKICDASTAHRTLKSWIYGFAELHGQREQIKTANRVAVPGCHATGFLALAAPLVREGLIPTDAHLACHSLTGYSGGGKQMIAAYEAPNRPEGYSSPRQYGLSMGHKHLPEMRSIAGLTHSPMFSPIVDDYYKGMLVSLPIMASRLPHAYNTPEKLRHFYEAYYAGEALIHVMPAGDFPEDGTLPANALAGRDDLEIWVLGNEEQILLAARFDNLGKGASGAAIQCANLMLGRDEYAALQYLR